MDEPEDVIEVRVMNEHGVDLPLWFDDEDGSDDADEVELSPQLTADLMAFAARWEANVDPAVWDDRFDGIPVVRALVDWGRALRNWVDREGRRRWKAEAAAMQKLGEELARRVQDELGPCYAVTYWG